MSITARSAPAIPASVPQPTRFATTGLIAESPPTGELFELAASARTAADGYFRFVWTLAPGKTGPGEHYHEDESESFEVVSGVLRIWISGVPRDLGPGESIVVTAGTPHRFLNPGKAPVVVNVSLSGPRMEDLLAPIAVVSRGRKARFGELLRMIVGIDVYQPSTPSRRFERVALREPNPPFSGGLTFAVAGSASPDAESCDAFGATTTLLAPSTAPTGSGSVSHCGCALSTTDVLSDGVLCCKNL